MKTYNITVNGKTYLVNVEEVSGKQYNAPATPAVATSPAPEKESAAPVSSQKDVPFGAKKITAPLPGTVIKICVNLGDTVKKGAVLCLIEAMKMENEVVCPFDGTIASVNVSKGAGISTGDVLFTVS